MAVHSDKQADQRASWASVSWDTVLDVWMDSLNYRLFASPGTEKRPFEPGQAKKEF